MTISPAGLKFNAILMILCGGILVLIMAEHLWNRDRIFTCECGTAKFQQQLRLNMRGPMSCDDVQLRMLDGSKIDLACKRVSQ